MMNRQKNRKTAGGDELRAIAAWLKQRARMKPSGKSFFVSEQRKGLHHSTMGVDGGMVAQ